jgi:nitrate/nitrite-specific signal transduction histidine kinase
MTEHAAMVQCCSSNAQERAWKAGRSNSLRLLVGMGTALVTIQRNEEHHRLALLDERSVIARELHDSLAQSFPISRFR